MSSNPDALPALPIRRTKKAGARAVLLDLAATYGWTAANKGDRLAVEIGKLAQSLEAA